MYPNSMCEVPRYLITTADERTWKFDCPVLFLGEWCRLYDRKYLWDSMDAIVAEPYGLQDGQKERDLAYIQEFSSQLLVEVVDMLNIFHNTCHSIRYWQILLGHWLRRYVAVAFNRYFTLERALKNYKVFGTTVFDCASYSLTTNDSLAFVWACEDDIWNHVFYTKVLNFLGNIKFTKMNVIPLQGTSGFVQEDNIKARQKRSVKQFILNITKSALPKFSRECDAFIINSFLPFKEEVKLQISLGQCPQVWRSPVLKNVAAHQKMRQRFVIKAENHGGFEQFVRSQLGEVIPTCFLEGYDELRKQVKLLPWPTKPKFIFTSNNFDTDEIFKAWTGLKVEKGHLYFTGQHGNNYGTFLGSQNWPELVTCDRFFTWGWTNGSLRNIPAFIFKTAGRRPPSGKFKDHLLLIEGHPPRRIWPQDSHFEFCVYQEEQFRFVAALPEVVREKLIVRLYRSSRDFRRSDEQHWRDRSPHTRIEAGAANIWDLIALSCLVVHSYDSTGILETLALDIPTVCFWNGGLNHLLPSAKPYYELLRKAGILADNGEQAAGFIATYWGSVSEWWESKKVQDARKEFCEQYARTEKYPVRTMKRLLAKAGKQVEASE